MFLKYCKNGCIVSVPKTCLYVLGYFAYIFNRGVDDSLKKYSIPDVQHLKGNSILAYSWMNVLTCFTQ